MLSSKIYNSLLLESNQIYCHYFHVSRRLFDSISSRWYLYVSMVLILTNTFSGSVLPDMHQTGHSTEADIHNQV